MRRSRLRSRGILTLLAAGLTSGLFGAARSSADVPDLLSYQGVITLASGGTPADGSYQVHFRILDAEDQVVFTETLPVEVRAGFYGVLLGDQGSGPLDAVFTEGPRFVELQILSGPEPSLVGAVLERQVIAPVPYALVARVAEAPVSVPAPAPTHAIILWDQPTGCDDVAYACPCGWAAAVEFEGMMVRGADTAQRWADLPDAPGVSMGGPTAVGKYGDTLSAAETPAHDHVASQAGLHTHGLPVERQITSTGTLTMDARSSPYGYTIPLASDAPSATGEGGSHSHTSAASGGGLPHLHAARRVLFCRKL